ncbi:hypothetical protein KIN20_036535 [Parelaphostrongylus tenuis]|uniref:Uncharacterized protein n=1 Tax=Parelaphostrongylus tenuis TaxID=148309 RepID=A0AAD5RD96_PARTN|nr:hypothetical protein KIN20_036535 [Parelaphostrongylus tenuis]
MLLIIDQHSWGDWEGQCLLPSAGTSSPRSIKGRHRRGRRRSRPNTAIVTFDVLIEFLHLYLSMLSPHDYPISSYSYLDFCKAFSLPKNFADSQERRGSCLEYRACS